MTSAKATEQQKPENAPTSDDGVKLVITRDASAGRGAFEVKIEGERGNGKTVVLTSPRSFAFQKTD